MWRTRALMALVCGLRGGESLPRPLPGRPQTSSTCATRLASLAHSFRPRHAPAPGSGREESAAAYVSTSQAESSETRSGTPWTTKPYRPGSLTYALVFRGSTGFPGKRLPVVAGSRRRRSLPRAGQGAPCGGAPQRQASHCRVSRRQRGQSQRGARPSTGDFPRGDPCGSLRPDPHARLTKNIREAAGILQISLLDHVIVGSPSPDRQPYFSFREAGLL